MASSARPLGDLRPPSRFSDARFSSYQAGSEGQRAAFREAQAFVKRVAATPSPADRMRGWLRALGGKGRRAPRGLYLVGPAGTGKTHLMAAALRRLEPDVPCAFLHSSTLFRTATSPEALAESLATGTGDRPGIRALMLDEVELDDAANEARLAHFLRALSAHGVALMATSNARPNEFLSRHVTGGAHQRFLSDALAGRCEVVLVRGDDRRRRTSSSRDGTVFVGEAEAARAALRDAYESAEPPKRWIAFADLRRATTDVAHPRLVDELLETDHLFVADVDLEGTDDALRLLRLVDDLYTSEAAPALHFSAAHPPEEWFSPDGHQGLRAGIAEKFARTVSRLRELCTVREVHSRSAVS